MVKVKTALTVLLMVSLLGIAACSDDDGDEGGTTTGAEEAETTAGGDETGTSAKESGEPILIKTHLAPLNAQGRVDWRGSVRVHHRRLSLLRRGEIHRWACGGFEPVGAEVVPLPRRHPGITFTSTPPGEKQTAIGRS